MSQMCVFVHEVGVLHATRNIVSKWEVWEAYNTAKEAHEAMRNACGSRPSWETEKFFKTTNRIRKYIPAKDAR